MNLCHRLLGPAAVTDEPATTFLWDSSASSALGETADPNLIEGHFNVLPAGRDMPTDPSTTSAPHDRAIMRPLLRAARVVNRLESVLEACNEDNSRVMVRHALEIARESFRRCGSEYLELGSSVSGRGQTDFSVRDVLGSVREGCEHLASRRGLHCDFAANPRIPDHLSGEAILFSRSLQALCAHALHRIAGGGICVRVVVDREHAGTIELRATVSDTGAGTVEDFERVRPSGPSSFAIERCREEIESIGGTFGIEHEPGRGSTSWFTMRFKMSLCTAQEAKSVHETHALVVGRDAEETRLLGEYFDCWDIRHTPCADIEELGITLRLSSDHADLLIVGAHDNLELIEINEGVHAVIDDNPPSMVGISDDDDSESLAAARRAGIAAIINRPLEQSAMFDAVLAALTHCKVVRESACRDSEHTADDDAPRATVSIDDESTAHAVMFILESCGIATAIVRHSDCLHQSTCDEVNVMERSITMSGKDETSTQRIARTLIPQLIQRMTSALSVAHTKAA